MDDLHCSRCGLGLTTVRDGGRDRQGCPACGYVVYRNPVPVAMALAWQDGRMVLVRRGNQPLNGFWAPPAGYVELEESVEEAAVRETEEETGLKITIEGLRGVYSAPRVGVVLVVYRARVDGGTPAAGPEVLDVGLFAAGAMPAQPTLVDGSELDRWFLGLLPRLMGGGSDGAGDGRQRMRELEERLRSVLAEVDSGRDEMADADVNSSLLRRAGSLRREIEALRRLEMGT